MKPDVLERHPEPHRFFADRWLHFFDRGFHRVIFGSPVLGWTLVWIVIALAALNAFGGFLRGFAVYYWLARLGCTGFGKLPPAGIFPA